MKIDRSRENHPTDWRVIVTLDDNKEVTIYRKGLTDFEYYRIAQRQKDNLLNRPYKSNINP